MKILFNALLLIIFCGCTQLKPAAAPDFKQLDHSLWDLKITHHEKTVFSGLLILKEKDKHMQTAVLDASGITIMTGRFTGEGEMEVFHCLAPARKHDLPGFLGPALAFIFYQAPDRECFQDDKYITCHSGFLPFSLWTVSYFCNNDNRKNNMKNGKTEIILDTPGADLMIDKIRQTEK